MKNGILHEAIRIRGGERNADYGDAVENFRRITEIANDITGLSLTSIQICKIMMAVKLARERHRHKRDNLVDLCGYADILDLLEQENTRKQADKPMRATRDTGYFDLLAQEKIGKDAG